MTRCREHLVERFPEAERAIADRDFRRDPFPPPNQQSHFDFRRAFVDR
jgi:hypothetical protein